MSIAACTLALLLSMDTSASMTEQEYYLEAKGFASGIESPEVIDAVRQSYPLAVRVDHWASEVQNAVPWTVLHNDAELHAFANTLRHTPRATNGDTMLALGIDAAIEAFNSLPCEADRKVIDVSGDGKDSRDLRPQDGGEARELRSSGGSRIELVVEKAAKYAITINGLPILNPNEPADADVVEYYQNRVVTPDGFVVKSDGFEDVARAIRRKLQAEIS